MLAEIPVKQKQLTAEPQTYLVVDDAWSTGGKIAFRFFFIFFLLQAVPLDWNYYRDLFARDWSSFHFSNLFYAARYAPRFFEDFPTFLDWLVISAIAAAGAFVWGVIETDRKNYNSLYYWLRVIIRYRLAAALLAYGFIKFFPQQMPLPSLSNLNTNYGDLTDWKIFSMSTGIVPGYQSFLGFVEIGAALLLLNRKTTIVGAFIILPFTGNVALSNLAYEGGEYVYAFMLVSFAAFLVAYDFQRLYKFASESVASPNRFVLALHHNWQRNGRLVLKSLFISFVLLYGYETYSSFSGGGYQYSTSPGIAGLEGIYDVTSFKVDGEIIPPSRTHETRWRDVVFEKWSTLSVRSNEPIPVKSTLTEEVFMQDSERDYEFAGNAGRKFYSYRYDQVGGSLVLENRNNSNERFLFNVDISDSKELILTGADVTGRNLEIILKKINKKYLLEEAAKNGRRKGLKL